MVPDQFTDDTGRILRLADEAGRQGGQATVYKAWLGDRPVAVKVYHRGLDRAAMERELMDDIARDDPEADSWVLTVLGAGTLGGRPFLVLPWIEGSLGDWVEGRPLQDRVAVLISATEAVARLHRSRRDLTGYRVHRDIKPDNLLVGWEGGRWVARLADLGAAKAGAVVGLTTNTAVLTESFAPPEQALPLDQEPRESWDVHATAVTIYWVLTGRLPIVALDAPGLLNGKGRELINLRRKQAHASLSELDTRRLEALRRARPEQLLDLEDAVGWREEDTAHLRRVFEDAGVTEEKVLAQLVDALTGALHPDGRLRANDVRKLLVALKEIARRLPEPTAAAPVAPGAPEPSRTIEPATWAPSSLPPSVGEVAALDLVSTGGLGAPAIGPSPWVTGPVQEGTRSARWVVALVAVVVAGGLSAVALGSAAIWWGTQEPTVAAPGSGEATEVAAVPEPVAEEPAAPTQEEEPAPEKAAAGKGKAVEPPKPAEGPKEPAKAVEGPKEPAKAVEPAVVEPPVAAPVMRQVRVKTCADSEVQVSAPGAGSSTVSGLSAWTVTLADGPQTITWKRGGHVYSRTVTVSEGATKFCHTFAPASCPYTCAD